MGERESEVRQMEVGGCSTLHCTHGDDEGRESRRGGGGGDEKQDSTTASRLHDTEALQSTTKVRPRVEMATWVMAGRWPVALAVSSKSKLKSAHANWEHPPSTSPAPAAAAAVCPFRWYRRVLIDR